MYDLMQVVGGMIGTIVSTSQFGFMRFPGMYAIAEVPIDTFLKVDHESRATPTKYPVETGANYSDHIVIEPMRVTISGLISDLDFEPYLYGVTPLLGGMESFMNYMLNSKSSAIWNQLKAVQTSRVLFSVDTGLEWYDNMCITSLKVTQDKNSLTSLRFVAVCEEILTIDFEQRQDNLATTVPESTGGTSTTEIARSNGSTQARTAPKKKAGKLKEKEYTSTLYEGSLYIKPEARR